MSTMCDPSLEVSSEKSDDVPYKGIIYPVVIFLEVLILELRMPIIDFQLSPQSCAMCYK